jgi:signal transduction histidine kinase
MQSQTEGDDMSIYRSGAAGLQGSDKATTIAGFHRASAGATVQAEALRLHLARELHDRAGWHLSALNYGIFAVETAPGDPEAMAELRHRFEALAATLREITTDLRHGQTGRTELVGELSALCSDWTRITKIPVVLQSGSTRMSLPRKVTETFVSLVREALTNVSKHAAGASRVEITLSGSAGEAIRVAVADDGPGIDPARLGDAELADHHGLEGMRERLQRIGGALRIRPGEARGTVLVFDLPMDRLP